MVGLWEGGGGGGGGVEEGSDTDKLGLAMLLTCPLVHEGIPAESHLSEAGVLAFVFHVLFNCYRPNVEISKCSDVW